MERSIFKENESEIIRSVGETLRISFNFMKDTPSIFGTFQNILQIFEGLRSRIAEYTDEKGLKTQIHIEAEEVKGEKEALRELRLYITQEIRSRVFESLAWPTKKSKQTSVLILTSEGYRQATPERIDEDRFNSSGRPRIARYSPSSYSNIKDFLEKIHRALNKALNQRKL